MSKFKIIRSWPVVLQDDEFYLGNCREHDLPYEECICPKPHSTPALDGWFIEIKKTGEK